MLYLTLLVADGIALAGTLMFLRGWIMKKDGSEQGGYLAFGGFALLMEGALLAAGLDALIGSEENR